MLLYALPSIDFLFEVKPFIKDGTRNPQCFFSGMVSLDNFNARWGNSKSLG
jgi:hypothetical protein